MTFPTNPTYDQILGGCQRFTLTKFIVNPPDVIVGIIRGGMINAVILSHLYDDVPVVALDYASRKGQGDNKEGHTNMIPELPRKFGELPGLKRVLVVDDICDSGYTMKEIVDEYKSRGHVVLSYASYLKSSSVFQPNGWTWSIPEDAPWVTFPWE